MKVLVLGARPSPLTPVIVQSGCEVIEYSEPFGVNFLEKRSVDFAVSYRFKHILRKPVIDYLQGNIINLHISLLPWNRGADPNLWSFLENTPKGVTIHFIDEGLDTGDIIANKEVVFDIHEDTLATMYDVLNKDVIELFEQQWPFIMQGNAERRKQRSGGSSHKIKDKDLFEHFLIEKGWDTPVAELIGKATK